MMPGSPRWLARAAALGFLVVTLVAPLAAAQAQQSAPFPVVPGSRVRIKAPNLVAPLVGSFLQLRGDTAVFIEDGAGRGIWSIPIADIQRIERSDGERKVNREYMVRGGLLGAGGGALAGFALAASLSPDNGKKYNRALSGGVGAILGGAIGAGIGSRVGAEKWTNVPLPKRMTLVPQGRGLGLRFGFDF